MNIVERYNKFARKNGLQDVKFPENENYTEFVSDFGVLYDKMADNLKDIGRRFDVLLSGQHDTDTNLEITEILEIKLPEYKTAYDIKKIPGGTMTNYYRGYLRNILDNVAELSYKHSEIIKNKLAGIETENTDTLKHLHPIQQMGLIFGYPGPLTTAKPDVIISTGKLSVEYDVMPLINYKSAESFGPLDEPKTGLSSVNISRIGSVMRESKTTAVASIEVPKITGSMNISVGTYRSRVMYRPQEATWLPIPKKRLECREFPVIKELPKKERAKKTISLDESILKSKDVRQACYTAILISENPTTTEDYLHLFLRSIAVSDKIKNQIKLIELNSSARDNIIKGLSSIQYE